jgi:N-methylhydantoinase A
LNAYTGPALGRYLESLVTELKENGFEGTFLVMMSSGGVASAEVAARTPVSAIRSGPAGCAIATSHYAADLGQDKAVSFDMGGTSLDVALVVDGNVSSVRSADFNRYRVAVPMVDLVSVGAGGGSVARLDAGGLLHVGPDSAGADPGPACYGRGGLRPTVTDADLVLGYINPGVLMGGDVALDPEAAKLALYQDIAEPLGIGVTEAASLVYEVVNVNMATAVREFLQERGQDPKEFVMVVAGGAGPLHAVPVAEEIGIRTVIVPVDAAIFSAVGLLMADLKHDLVRTHYSPLSELDYDQFSQVYRDLEAVGRDLLESEGVDSAEHTVEYSADLRYERQINEIEVTVTADQLSTADSEALAQSFHDGHRVAYGYSVPESPIDVVNVRVVVIGRTPPFELPERPPSTVGEPSQVRPVMFTGQREAIDTGIYTNESLGQGAQVPGPALIESAMTSVLVPEGWTLEVDRTGNYVLQADP